MSWEIFHLGTMSWEQCHEYVRKGYDITEDLYSPRTASMDFVSELVRKRGKDNLQKFILFGLTIYIIRQIKAQEEEFETFNLKIVHRKNRTGFEEDKNFHVVLNSVIAGCYHVFEYLGSAAFSKAFKHMTCTLVWMFVSK